MAFPTFTKSYHTSAYPAILATRPELSTAGKSIFITGGGSGLGPGIAQAFAVSGSTKITIIGRTADSLAATKSDVEAKHPGVQVLTHVADIVDKTAVDDAFAASKHRFGPVDILVANAGYLPDVAPLVTADLDEFMRGFDVNVRGNINAFNAFLANSSEHPTLVHLSTGAAHAPAMLGGMGAYAISKLAAAKLMEYAAFENPHVRVHVIHPGVVETPMYKKIAGAGLHLPFDEEELTTNFVVWITSAEAGFLRGRFVWSNWDVEELIARKEELLASSKMTLGLLGWVEGIEA